MGRKLLLTALGDSWRIPEKQTLGTVTASHTMLTLHALSSSLNAGTANRGCLGRGKAFVLETLRLEKTDDAAIIGGSPDESRQHWLELQADKMLSHLAWSASLSFRYV